MYLFLNLKHHGISEHTDPEAIFLKSEELLNANDFNCYPSKAVQ